MINEPDLDLLTKFIAGECSSEEYERVCIWKDKNADNAKLIQDLQKTWRISERFLPDQDEDQAWKNLADKLFDDKRAATIHPLNRHSGRPDTTLQGKEESSRKSALSGVRIYGAAVVTLLIIGLCYLLAAYQSPRFFDSFSARKTRPQDVVRKVTAPPGQRVRLTLSDGTHVLLNGNSVIRFPEKFGGKSRKVELKGEAYFMVVHDDSNPFIVHTTKADIRDLGTKFDVCAYPGDAETKVIVQSGMVAVRSSLPGVKKQGMKMQHPQNEEAIVTAGQMTEVKKNGIPTAPRNVNTDIYLDWIKGQLLFDNTPLKEVIKKLERYYGKKFVVSDSSLYKRRLTAYFDKELFSKVMDVMALTMDLRYTADSDSSAIVLSPRVPEK